MFWWVTTLFLRLWLLMNIATSSSVLSYWLTFPSSLQLLTCCYCFFLDFFLTRSCFHVPPLQPPYLISVILYNSIFLPQNIRISLVAFPVPGTLLLEPLPTSSINKVQPEVTKWCRMHTFYISNIFTASTIAISWSSPSSPFLERKMGNKHTKLPVLLVPAVLLAGSNYAFTWFS